MVLPSLKGFRVRVPLLLIRDVVSIQKMFVMRLIFPEVLLIVFGFDIEIAIPSVHCCAVELPVSVIFPVVVVMGPYTLIPSLLAYATVARPRMPYKLIFPLPEFILPAVMPIP